MSKGNSPIKVLHTALKRVRKGWSNRTWHSRVDGKSYVCLEGAIYGYCDSQKHAVTDAQRQAINVVQQIILEKYGKPSIPAFNDANETTEDDIAEVIKLAIIRLETGGGEDEVMDDEDFEDLVEFKDSR